MSLILILIALPIFGAVVALVKAGTTPWWLGLIGLALTLGAVAWGLM